MGFLENTHPTRPRVSNIRNDLFIFACHKKRHGERGLFRQLGAHFGDYPRVRYGRGNGKKNEDLFIKPAVRRCVIYVCTLCPPFMPVSNNWTPRWSPTPPEMDDEMGWGFVFVRYLSTRPAGGGYCCCCCSLRTSRLPEALGRIIWTLESNRRTQNYQLQSGVGV